MENLKNNTTELQEILNAVNSLPSGGSGVDTSKATVTPEDMAEGVIAIGANGEEVTGNVRVIGSNAGSWMSDNMATIVDTNTDYYNLTTEANVERLYRKGAKLFNKVSKSEFGTATSSDVAKGVTFTSESGLKVEGTLAEVTPSSDGTTACAPSNGHLMYKLSSTTGTIEVYTDTDVLLRAGTGLYRDIPFSEFGTATVDQVLEGVTFTGAGGFKKTGTMKASSGVTIPDGAVVAQLVMGAEASTQVASGYNASVTYGDGLKINDSLAIAFVGSTQNLGSFSDTTDFTVLYNKYIRTGSSASSYKYYYIPDGAGFTVGGSTYSKTLTCDRAQSVTIQKVTL